MKKSALLIFCGWIAMAGIFHSCDKDEDDFSDSSGSFKDARDGHVYKWVKIGDQIWMAENLAYLPVVNNPQNDLSESEPYYYVYNYFGSNVEEARETENYRKYGAMYNWPAVMDGNESSDLNPSGIQGACPDGWHLPSNSEWKELEAYLGMSQDEIEKESNRGTDQGDKLKEGGSAGLDLLFGGWMNIYGRFHSFGTGGGYWTSTDDAPLEDGPWRRWISSSSSQFNNDDMSRDDAYYCRCVKDED